jgi:hypothetical protein
MVVLPELPGVLGLPTMLAALRPARRAIPLRRLVALLPLVLLPLTLLLPASLRVTPPKVRRGGPLRRPVLL